MQRILRASQNRRLLDCEIFEFCTDGNGPRKSILILSKGNSAGGMGCSSPEDFNLLSDRQHGFRRSKSTITALTEIIEIALEHRTREYAGIIAVDISAAFDNAWWPALMKRLDEDGVQASTIKLLQSYFDNRRIRYRYSSTEINKKLSKGCPQGGPLSPTLWNIIINEIMNKSLDDICETIGYADDITLICWNKTPEQLRKTIDNVLRKVNNRKLKLSDEKTKILYLYKCNIDIIVSGSKLIKPVEELKILGVIIKNHRVRSKLDFTPQVNEMIIKVTRASGYLFGLTKKAWGLDFRRRLILYKTLYRSTITYGYPIWYPFINKKSKDKLNSLQYKILKHCIQAYSTTSSDCTHILAQVPKLTNYIESNMLKTEINYNRFDSSNDLKWRAVGRMEAGQSQVEVAKWLNVNKSVVSKIWKQFIETGTIKRKEGSGRKRKTATSEDRYLVVTAKRHREMTAIQLSNELSSATGTRISRKTVYRRLHEGALYARRPMVCISLTSAHRRERLKWCLEHHAWTHDQSGLASVLAEAHPSTFFSGGTLTAQRYRDEILEPYLRPYKDQIGHNLFFMDDNARPHRARLVNEYLQSDNIRRMDWPARSPDLNPIEHAWDALGRRIGARHPSHRTLVELRNALLEE
ncbi:hypothetical protein LAZ67_10000923 [Cordylochernes scorpioides]|uniref:Reverse transcriptase domain-containing protein n=1 Tax=Cordylochernes scorpioides TaxID=51811 RepID=A0ABY6KVW3_9ARAC|nr:hypothetical protein LAZ67_10000923 [Cordylochernes scorpioides]